MYLLIFLAVLSTVASVPISNEDLIVTTNQDLAAQYLLPGESIPTFYDVRLFLDPSIVEYFYGNVSIRIIPTRSTSEIVLQTMELEIDNIEVYSERDADSDVNIFQNFTLARDDTHFLRIQVDAVLNVAQPYVVHINYVGKYAENMFGVYLSSYEHEGVGTVNLVTSQLQPTFARRAFPCYDEPGVKAIFRTTIYAPEEYHVVRSNMPERNDTLKEDVPGYVKHEFEDTLKMSTYLIAYLVSNFEYIGNEENPIYEKPFKVFSRNGTQDTAEFALEFGQQNLKVLENYTELEYAFPKMDKVAVPDFAAGAMENWGLVIYREVALLVRDGVTTTATKQNIGRIITHENVHQWFGNEVSPFTWTHTWLNEGFATFFEMFATDLVLPGWRMMDQFVLNMQNVFQSDAVLSVNPMTHEVYTPSQILGTFNAVAYQKSGSVIRMLQHILTPEVFRKGLVIYLKNNVQSAILPSHLYAALQQTLDESNFTIPYTVNAIMQRWTTQGGFPVINVRRSSPGAESVSISQERFLTDRSLTSNDGWHVPVNWVLSSNVDFSDTSPQAWVPPTGPAAAVDIAGLSEAEWFMVNKQQTGYYRVNYDPDNWHALVQMMNASHENIHVLNRAQLVDDAFNLARNGRLAYVHALQLSLYLVKETDYIPWAAANAAINYLDIVLSASPVYTLFRYYTLNLTAPLYDTLGFEAGTNEEHVTPYHRNIILDINCRHGNERCVSQAEEMLQNSETQPLNPDIQTTVYCSALRGGNPDYFQMLWNKYLASTDSSEQSILLNALGCTSDEDSRTGYLNEVIDDDSPVREQDKHTIIVSVINSSPENMEAALEFILENFDQIQPRVQGLTGTTNILNALSRRLNTEEHLKKIEEFETRYDFTPGELASISSIKENIGASITWSRENLLVIDDWLRITFGNNANILTSSLLIIVSVIVTIYNY